MRNVMRRFGTDQTGAASLVMIFVLAILSVVGGLMLDLANRYRAEAALQAAADIAAASGAIRLGEPIRLSSPRDQAYAAFETSLGRTNMADAWVQDSFRLGNYDPDSGAFTITTEEEEANAVRVTLVRSPLWNNAEPTLMLGLIGVSGWDIRVSSVARVRTMHALPCPDPLLSLQALTRVGRSDLFAGICLSAEVELTSQPPEWLSDSATDLIGAVLTSLVAPSIRPVSAPLLRPRDFEAALTDLLSEARPVRGETFDPLNLGGTVLRISCPDSGVLSLRGPLQLSGVAILSECPVRFDPDVVVGASLIITNLRGLDPRHRDQGVTSDAHLMDASACAPGDGARIYLFASASVRASVPLLDLLAGHSDVDALAPVSGLLSGLLGSKTGLTLQAALNDAIGICLGAEAMAAADRVSLQ